VHVDAQALEGYEGRKRPEKAHIILPRRQVGSGSNDLGFVIQPDGSITAIVSDFDSHRYGATWMGELTRLTTIHTLLKAAKKKNRKAERIRDEVTGKEKVRVYA